MWTPTPFDIYQKAIYDEGTLTLSVVTKNLYEGEDNRPDIYFKSEFGTEKYKNTFNGSQRTMLESYSGYFEIRTAVKDYDISLQYLLQGYVCGLSPKGTRDWQIQGTLENLLSKVHHKRNEVTHQTFSMSQHELRENLEELRSLYGDILNHVERRASCIEKKVDGLRREYEDENSELGTFGKVFFGVAGAVAITGTSSSIDNDRSLIMDGLERKFPSNSAAVSRYKREEESSGLQNLNYMQNRHSSNNSGNVRRKEEESSGLGTFGKVALGVAGAAAITGIVAAVMNNNDDDKKKEDQRRSNSQQSKGRNKSSQEEECSIM